MCVCEMVRERGKDICLLIRMLHQTSVSSVRVLCYKSISRLTLPPASYSQCNGVCCVVLKRAMDTFNI